MNAGAASADADAAGSAAALATAACAERCGGAWPGSVDDAKDGALDSVCALAAQTKPADTMQTNDESDEEKFMTNRTE
ncbi:hypothetical protein [Burkholderia sp. BCC0419]|uniref:hypothetical protein n=1 Tax=Burkholderia sp. BCC0419 TaxID=486878 RepID=UPI00158BB618|nr:hypothetical protein [Burkholderia sp. BCC0419]